MIKILIIGKRGFIGNNLYEYLKRYFKVNHISFSELNKYQLKFNSYDYIINTSINKNYINKKYNSKFDNDFKILNLIKNNKTTYIFLSSRKVYKSQSNITENSKLLPKSNYSKNKLITEKILKKNIKKKLLILRVSNVIGDKSSIKKIHKTFIDIFFNNLKKGYILDNNKIFKDFIGIDKFCEIVRKLIQKRLVGVFNVSIGEKIYLNDIIGWLNKFNKQKQLRVIRNKNITDSFYLNNRKLMSKINIKNSKSDLMKYCFKISKKNFY
tara:strand:- start:575 stop:1378 length:804 start_codon:yes stop_codon:yes gene_type:complete